MRKKTGTCIVLGASLLSGCVGLKESIQQRVEVSEECRAVTAVPFASSFWGEPGAIASFQLGNVGFCDLRGKDSLIAMCSLNQITAKYDLIVPHSSGDAAKKAVTAIEEKVQALRTALNKLAEKVRTVDDFYKTLLEKSSNPVYSEVTRKMAAVDATMGDIRTAFNNVQAAQKELKTSVDGLGAALNDQARAELIAWDMNLRVQLQQLEQLLSGNVTLLVRAGLKDQILTHTARRSLELLHGALKPADAILGKLDQKTYGAVSIGYLAFGPNLQSAVSKARENVKEVYSKRIESLPAQQKDIEPFMVELKRAACDNLVQGTQFSMLSELVDTMLIQDIKEGPGVKNNTVAALANPPQPASLESRLARLEASQSVVQPGWLKLRADGELAVDSAALLQDPGAASTDAMPATVQDTPASPPEKLTPYGVYAVNEWTARQQLLTQRVAAKLNAIAGTERAKAPFPGIEDVDESAVRRLAESATAQSIDDAARIDPTLLGMKPIEAGALLANNINVASAASTVSIAAVALQLNLTVSNVNSFNPTNTNMVAPVVNVATPAAPAAAPPVAVPFSLCAAADFRADGVTCSIDGKDFVISFQRNAFRDDSCAPRDMALVLAKVGKRLADLRARHGVEYDAAIEGHASLSPAKLTQCPAAAHEPASVCSYVNLLREKISVEPCSSVAGDGNLILSAARATTAAGLVEHAAQGALVVKGVSAVGTKTALERPKGAAPALDQTVVIRLTPKPPR